jgi:O-antigen/teichoic acid export membrane protein
MAAGLGVDVSAAVLLRGLALATTVVVARKLSPADYGAVSLALSVYGVSDMLTNPPLGVAVVRRPELDDRTIDVAWTLSVLRAAVFGIGIWAAAPLLARLWHGGAETASHLRLLSLAPLTSALSNMHVVRWQRALRFGRSMLLDNSRLLATSLSSLLLLILRGDAAALIQGILIGNLAYVGLSWLVVSPRPRVAFSSATARELTQVSRWLMAHSILVYLSVTVDNLFVSRAFGLASLGAYALAWRVVNTFMTLLTRSIGKMLLPTYRNFGEDAVLLRRTVLAALYPSGAVGALASGLVLLSASDIFLLVAGHGNFPGAATAARALTPFVLSRILNNVLSPLYQGVGSPRTLALLSVLNLTLMFPMMYAGSVLGGVAGVAVAVSLASVAVTATLMFLVSRRFGIELREQLRAVVLPLVALVPGLFLGHWLLASLPGAALRLGSTAVVLFLSFVAVWETSRRTLNGVPSLVLPLVRGLKGLRARPALADDS